MPQPDKIKKVEDISDSLKNAKSVFMADFTGLSVDEITRLRREFRKANVNFVVVKNTLAKLAAKESGYDQLVQFLTGPTGLALSNDDPIAPGRVIFDFQREKEKPTIKAAVLGGELLDQKAAQDIRNIPPREVLLAQVVGGISAPLSGLVGSLNALLSKLVYTLDAIKDKKSE